jgi:hypothetical protein
MASATLNTIYQKVRRLTRSPSTQQLSDADLNQYVNTFILYNFPEHLRLFSLRTTLTFYTQPYQDVYQTITDPAFSDDPLFNFQNRYITVHPTAYIAGRPAFFTQKRDIFYGNYPQTNFILNTGLTGNGTPGTFTGTLEQFPVIAGSVLFTALDIGGQAMQVIDYPVSNVTGALGIPGVPQTLPSPYGQISYPTGQFTLNFPANTQNSIDNIIYAEGIFYKPGLPFSILYFDNKFTLRPVPDRSYAVQIEADIRPTELINTSDVPTIEQWWQFIAYGTAKLVLEDKMDLDTVNLIMPEFNAQMDMVNRTNLVQQANERTTTIYTLGKNYGWGWGWGSGSNWPF